MATNVTRRLGHHRGKVRGDRLGPPLGVHVSVAGGLPNGLAEGVRLGCDCVQIFVKNQRQWRSKPLTDEQVVAFRAAHRESGIQPVIAHANYLLNLASPAGFTRNGSIDVLTDELTRCEALGVAGLVLHPGAHLEKEATKRPATAGLRCDEATKSGPSRDRGGAVLSRPVIAGIERIAASLDELHRCCAGFKAMILLETTAGQGTSIGWRFEELRGILDRVRDPDRLGVCLDTCHLFAAGYDIRSSNGYAATMDEFERVIGVSLVRCIHTNDSKRELGSRVDRHEHIGKGAIGKQGFANFLNDPRWCNTPFILETPKGFGGRGAEFDKLNLNRLRSLVRRSPVV